MAGSIWMNFCLIREESSWFCIKGKRGMAGFPLARQSCEERKQKWERVVGASCGTFNKSMSVVLFFFFFLWFQ